MLAEIVFYNGFNLAVDVALLAVSALWFHGVGYRKAKRQAEKKFRGYVKPPF